MATGRRQRRGTTLALAMVLAGLAVSVVRGAGAIAGPAAVDAGAEAEARDAGPGAATAAPRGPRPVPVFPKDGRVLVVEVHGTIDLGLAPFIDRVLAAAGPGDVVVLDINTHGGRLDGAVVIRDALLRARTRTACWVNPRAISAGALISLACDVIAVAPGATIGAATPVQIGQDGEMKAVDEKVVSYMRKEMRATAEAKGRRGDIAEAMVDADVAIPGLDEKGKLLTLDGGQALAWGIAELSAASEAELFRGLGVSPAAVERPRITWAERVARFLSDPIVSGLLMTLGMLGVLIELYSPGHGVSLGIGLLCLALFFFGQHVVMLAGWEEILLFIVGVGLLGFEVFVPGHILPGVAGVALIVLALILALVNLEHVPFEVAWKAGWLSRAVAMVMGSVLMTALLGVGAARLFPRTRAGRALVLDAAIRAPATQAAADSLAPLVGERGAAATDLRPSGKVSVGGRRVEAVAERGYVDAGAAVRVVRVDGGHLVVQAADEEQA